MKAILEPKIVAARTQRPADLLHSAVASFERMLASSQGCLTILAISVTIRSTHDIDRVLRSFLLKRLEHHFVNVTPAPFLARLERLSDRVLRPSKVLRGVSVLRRVAAADVTARLAEAQVHPRISGLKDDYLLYAR
jgi:hypothetical protein